MKQCCSSFPSNHEFGQKLLISIVTVFLKQFLISGHIQGGPEFILQTLSVGTGHYNNYLLYTNVLEQVQL